jgi:transposase
MVDDLRALMRLGHEEQPTATIFYSRTPQSSPESGDHAGYDGAKRRKGSKTHNAVDTMGYLLALLVTPTNEQDGAQVGQLAQAVQEATSETVGVAFVDQGYTGDETAQAAEAKKGFVLLPRRWVVERNFGWMARFCRLARDYERLPDTLKGLHFLAFAILMAHRFVQSIAFLSLKFITGSRSHFKNAY